MNGPVSNGRETNDSTPTIADRLLAWFDVHGRKNLPWQHPRTPYRVWISEVMLQQTQVATVIPYFERFVARFPDVRTLARAGIDDVLHLWTGLGYYARGRNLHAAARRIVEDFEGELPRTLDELQTLPGIGRSTAGAILSTGHDVRAPILDGNVKRVLARHFAVSGYPGERATADLLWRHAEANTPYDRVADYTQAIMDLGATLCTRANPRCDACPLCETCAAHRDDAVSRFPSPRPRKALPVRRVRMFLLTHADRCLLERRPPAGLWGGLWNPPERAPDFAIDALLDEFVVPKRSVADVLVMPTFRHTFTHFHMDIEALRIELTDAPARLPEGVCWYGLGTNESLGLSAVAVRLIETIRPLVLT